LDLKSIKKEIKNKNYTNSENWLNQQKWYSFDARIPHVKLFWLHVFDKKRPSMISNYIIPSESEMLSTLAENSGISVVWDINAKQYLKENKLQLLWNSSKMPSTEIYLLARKNDTLNAVLNEVKEEISTYILN